MVGAIHVLSLQPWVLRLGWTLVHFLWQGIAIAAVYAAARRTLPGSRNPQGRYVLACGALAALLAAPAVTFRILTPRTQPVAVYPYTGRVPASSPALASVRNSAGAAPVIATRIASDAVMPSIVLAWFAGTIVFWIRLTGGWLAAARMRQAFVRPAALEWQQSLDRIRVRIGLSRSVRLLVSALVQAPTVIGWLRPIVLMPVGALAGLPAEHVEMLLAHELAHIRRHDYLVNILQSVAEALLFYHPAVWWISGHIRAEREICCDDIAVSAGGDALTYACALAGFATPGHASMSPALAANGGSLPERIGRLLNQPVRSARPRSGAAVAATILLALGTWGLLAQSQPAQHKFEAVSIKPNDLGGGHSHAHTSDGRIEAEMTPKSMIQMAFGIKSFQVSGGPNWLDENNYTINATWDAVHPAHEVLEACLQSMLADRFHLVYHRETKELPAYALMVAKNGPKLTPHTGTHGEGTNSEGSHGVIHMTGTDLTMAAFVNFLARETDRPVIDRTGIQGVYDVKMDWSTGDVDSTLPSLFSALQAQLGLRLESTKGPVEILVVDSIDKPSEN